MSSCRICGTVLNGEPLLRIDNAPACAQDLPIKDNLKDDYGMNLALHQCPFCGLVQFDCEPVIYYRDVIRGGGFSDTIQKLRQNQYRYFINDYHLENKKIIEIGCGEGEFLLPLSDFPVHAFGIENREPLVQKAVDRGLNVWKAFPETPDTIIENAPFDAFMMFNFLEHQPRPNDMMKCIYNNLTENGLGLITVPSFEYVYGKNAYYELMRDHIAYYTEDTLRLLMNNNGFEIIESKIINGNTVSAIIKKRKSIDLTEFADEMTAMKQSLSQFIKEKIKQDKRIAIWGASHEAFMILSTTELGQYTDYIIDSADYKQGKYAPASHIPIFGPDHFFSNPVESIIIIAPEYATEIAKAARGKFGDIIEIYSLHGSDLSAV